MATSGSLTSKDYRQFKNETTQKIYISKWFDLIPFSRRLAARQRPLFSK
jgi:hypothetical protein